MPYARPTLSQLFGQVASDISSNLGTDGTLRFANLPILGRANAAMVNGCYGYLDYIARQAVPYTASDEFLEAWAALRSVYREPATPAAGTATFAGTNGTVLPGGSIAVRGDGVTYQTLADATVASGSVTANVQAVLQPIDAITNPTGGGAASNSAAGTVLTLETAVTGITSTGTSSVLTGGADVELDGSLKSRMLTAYQNPPQGGAAGDYEVWALDVPGVTRAWVNPLGFGAGTVVVYTMFDQAEIGAGGFPQGTNGVAAAETRDIAATGDQLAVANYVYPLRPVTALVYSVAPIAAPQNFTIAGISAASTATKAAISAAIAAVLYQYGSPVSGVVDLSYIQSAIAAVAGTLGFVITSPAGNITTTTGQLPTLGAITYT